jgi:hypothetical protein
LIKDGGLMGPGRADQAGRGSKERCGFVALGLPARQRSSRSTSMIPLLSPIALWAVAVLVNGVGQHMIANSRFPVQDPVFR